MKYESLSVMVHKKWIRMGYVKGEVNYIKGDICIKTYNMIYLKHFPPASLRGNYWIFDKPFLPPPPPFPISSPFPHQLHSLCTEFTILAPHISVAKLPFTQSVWRMFTLARMIEGKSAWESSNMFSPSQDQYLEVLFSSFFESLIIWMYYNK